MKSFISKLSVLLVAAMFAVVGCQDYAEDIRQLNKKHDTDISSINALIEELQGEIADLEKIAATHVTKEELDALKTQLQGDLANVKKALEDAYKAADAELNTKIEAAKQAAQDALDQKAQVLEGQIDGVKKDVAAVYTYIETELIPLVNKAINDAVSASAETLRGEIAKAVTDLTAKDNALQASLNEAIGRIDKNAADILALQADLKTASDAVKKAQEDILKNAADIEAEKQAREQAVAALKAAYEAKVAQLEADLLANVAALNAEKAAREAADAALKAEYTAADAALKAALEKTINANAAAISTLQTKVATLESKVAELQTKVAQVLSQVEANEVAITEIGKQIDALEASVLETLENLKNKVEELATALRSVVLVPETMHNGTKAVKFHRMEGKNVLKTFSYVSFHFNPSNFDVASAQYEIIAENVEFRTKAVFAEEPTIEIVGTPVKDGDKVTFLLERGEGAGNMFALKVTLADGTTIYSEYAAILDEATFAVSTATSSFQVERLAFSFPSLNSISAIIEYVQSLGQTIEDFSSTIEAINAAVQAMQSNDVAGAIENLIKIPGLSKETATISGTGVYKVQVETLDAAEIIESLQNAQTIAEIRNILADLFAQAQGLGEAGSSIIDGLNGAFADSGLSSLFGEYDNHLNFELPELILTYNKAVATLDGYQAELDNARAELKTLEDEMAAIVAGLDETTRNEIATLEAEIAQYQANIDAILGDLSPETKAEIAELEAQYEEAKIWEKPGILAEIAQLMDISLEDVGTYLEAKTQISLKESSITAKAGTEYLVVKAELKLKEAGINTAEALVKTARKTVELAEQAKIKAEETLANLETEILNKVKDYIMNNTELGKYITELENALGDQAWEAKKQIAAGTAQLFAIDALIADLIKNYNAANQQVVDEFANSLFGRVAYLIQTQEAADAFELIGLTELYTVLKQLPDLLTLIIKYYPAGVDLTNFNNFSDFGNIFSDYLTSLVPETNVEWEIDYFLVDYVPAE